jgi:hypothetical protein
MSRRSIDLLTYYMGLVTSFIILIVETLIIIYGVDELKIVSPYELLYNPRKVFVYGAYIVSVVAIPAFVSWVPDAARTIVAWYKRFSISSLYAVDEKKVRVRIEIILTTLSLSSLLVIIAVKLSIPYLGLASLVPLASLISIIIDPLLKVEKHSKGIDDEFKWFLLLILSFEHVGVGIHYAIKKLSNTKLFSALSRELKVLYRDATIYFATLADALINRSNVTPSITFRKFLLSYAMRLKSGGDVVSWLKIVLNEELIKEEWTIRNYGERIATIVLQIAVAVFVLLPTLSVAIPIINPATLIVVVTVGGVILGFITYTTRPAKLWDLNIKHVIAPLLLLIVSAPLLYFIIGPQGIVMSWALAIAFGYRSYRLVNEVRELDLAALEIMKTVAELKRYGLEIPQALRFVSESKTLKPYIALRIKKLLDLLNSGHSFEEALNIIKTPSRLFNFAILYLGYLHECGASDEEAIQIIYEYLYKFKTHEDMIRRSSYIFELFAVANLFVLLWIWKTISKMINSIASTAQYLPLAPITLSGNIMGVIIAVSMISFSLVASIVRNSVPVFEPLKDVPKALITATVIAML